MLRKTVCVYIQAETYSQGLSTPSCYASLSYIYHCHPFASQGHVHSIHLTKSNFGLPLTSLSLVFTTNTLLAISCPFILTTLPSHHPFSLTSVSLVPALHWLRPSTPFWPYGTHVFFPHAQTISILSDLLYSLTPLLFQLSYAPLHS